MNLVVTMVEPLNSYKQFAISFGSFEFGQKWRTFDELLSHVKYADYKKCRKHSLKKIKLVIKNFLTSPEIKFQDRSQEIKVFLNCRRLEIHSPAYNITKNKRDCFIRAVKNWYSIIKNWLKHTIFDGLFHDVLAAQSKFGFSGTCVPVEVWKVYCCKRFLWNRLSIYKSFLNSCLEILLL